jgi:23S rRNA pseudouridine1911/1915/1917 synthase
VVDNDKKRLDSQLAKRYPENSRSIWQKYIKTGRISVNGTVEVLPKREIIETDTIEIDLPVAVDFSQATLPIIFMDDNVIVIDKPSGVLSHAKGSLNEEFTVAEFFRRCTTYNLNTNRPGIVHRLDRDTSGVMIGARSLETARLLQKQFASHKAKKTYVAVVSNQPKMPQAVINLPIIRNPSSPSTFKIDPNGKSAETVYQTLGAYNGLTLLRLSPKTGRTHQLRIHLQNIGAPIVGDKIYKGIAADRLYLHALALEITVMNSLNGQAERKMFKVDLPKEFEKIFPNARKLCRVL